ncbi:hypothetical protein Pelo_16784 [Pelomyxa schiedti]|nr:hypothetical protein Pelo_16784 [Pelomyxa schiedti]
MPKRSALDDEHWGCVHERTECVLRQFDGVFRVSFKETWLEALRGIDRDQREESHERDKRTRKGPTNYHRIPYPGKHEEVALCICDFIIVDEDVDPFIMYVIKATSGDNSSCVYRRFDQFKQLSATLGARTIAVLPEQSSGFFGLKRQRITSEYARAMLSKLQVYLSVLVQTQAIRDSKVFRQWLGLEDNNDTVVQEAFALAFGRLVSEKYQLYYDYPVEALCKFIVEESFSVFGPQVKSQGRNQKESTKLMKAAYLENEKIGACSTILQAERDLKVGMKPVMSEAMQEICGKYPQLMEIFMQSIQPLIVEILVKHKKAKDDLVAEIYKNFHRETAGSKEERETQLAQWATYLQQGAVEIKNSITHLVDGKITQIIESIAGQFDTKVGISGAVGWELLLGKVIAQFPAIIKMVFKFFNFRNQSTVFYSILKVKENQINYLVRSGHASASEFLQNIEKQESTLQERIWRSHRDMKFDAWKAVYDLRKWWHESKQSYREYLGPLLEVLHEILLKVALLNKQFFQKFIFRTNDFLISHVKEKLGATATSKTEFVQAAFQQGMDKAIKFFYKHGYNLLVDCIMKLFGKALVPAISQAIHASNSGNTAIERVHIPKAVEVFLHPHLIANAVIEELLRDGIKSRLEAWLHELTASSSRAHTPTTTTATTTSTTVKQSNTNVEPRRSSRSESGSRSGSDSASQSHSESASQKSGTASASQSHSGSRSGSTSGSESRAGSGSRSGHVEARNSTAAATAAVTARATLTPEVTSPIPVVSGSHSSTGSCYCSVSGSESESSSWYSVSGSLLSDE